MASTCPVCREVVNTWKGFFVRHGVNYHGQFELCSGSGSPVCVFTDGSCCG